MSVPENTTMGKKKPHLVLGDDHDFDQTVVDLEELLRHVNNVIRRAGRKILSEFDMTPPQLNALLQLQHHGNLTIGELSEKLYLAFSTATDLINRMERNELVARERDIADRRVVRLRILPKGTQLLDEIIVARCRYLEGILASVSIEDRGLLVNSLRKIDELMSPDQD